MIRNGFEMHEEMNDSCLLVDEQVFFFEQRPHRRFAPTPPAAFYDLLGMDPQVFLASAQCMLDDLTRARSEAWAREQASRAADRAAETAGLSGT
jgi:hypothetical protein